MGDQCLIGVMGALNHRRALAPERWIPDDTATATRTTTSTTSTPSWGLRRSSRQRPDLVVSQLNTPTPQPCARPRQRGPRSPRTTDTNTATRSSCATTSTGTTPCGSSCPITTRRPSSTTSRSTLRPRSRIAGWTCSPCPKGRDRRLRRRRDRRGTVRTPGGGRRGNRSVPPRRPRPRGVSGVVRARAHVRVRRTAHRARDPRWPAHPHAGGGGDRWPPAGHTASRRRATVTAVSHGRLGTDPSPRCSASHSPAPRVVRLA